MDKDLKNNKNEKKELSTGELILGLIVFAIVMRFLMGLVQMCTGSNYDPLDDTYDYGPRHTQIIKPYIENQEYNSDIYKTFIFSNRT